jgi:signal transduction histidine kinase/DNA-binding response OmpR family regulator/ligand-binding sensor domain-containing protein
VFKALLHLLGNCGHASLLWLVASLLLSLGPQQVSAQEYQLTVRHWDIEDGLLERTIDNWFEDKEGFIWLVTPSGVQRFDGYEFTTWTQTNAGRSQINATIISQDQAGVIWFDATAFYDPTTRKMMGASEMFSEGLPFNNDLYAPEGWREKDKISEFSNGDFLFLCNRPHKLCRYNPENGFSCIPLSGFPETALINRLIDSNSNIWISADSLLYKINEQGDILEKYEFPPVYNFYPVQETNGNFYVTTIAHDNLSIISYVISPEGKISLHDAPLPPPEIVNSPLGLEWVLADNALEYRDISDGKIVASISGDFFDEHLTGPNVIMKTDRQGALWISTGSALVHVSPTEAKFKRFISFEESGNKAIENSTRNIVRIGDSLFVACERQGIVAIPLQAPEAWGLLTKKTTEIVQSYPRALLPSKGQLHIGFREEIFSYPNGHFLYQTPPGSPASNHLNGVWSMYEDADETIWATTGVLDILYRGKEDSSFSTLTVEKTSSALSLRGNFPLQIAPDGEGNLWIPMYNGLYQIDRKNKKITAVYGKGQPGEFDLPSNNIQYIYTDKDDIRWLGSRDGLIRWDPETNDKRLFTRLDGLSNVVIHAIFEDDHNHLWLSSNYGIMQFNKETFKVRAYYEQDGISHVEFNRASSLQDADGTIYFGGLNGITAFHPNDFYGNEEEAPPPMVLSEYRKFDGKAGEEVELTGQLNSTGEIHLRSNDRYFRLKVSLLTFDKVERITYAYLLEGIDADWNYQDANTFQLSKLPYGSHQLRIKGQDGYGRWSPKELSYTVHVIKPIYLRTWFIFGSILLLIGAIVTFFRERTRTLKKEIALATSTIQQQADELRQLDRLKSRFFANVSHELRTPLTLMLGPIRRLIRRTDNTGEESKLLSLLERNTIHLRGLVNEILDLSKLENNKMALREEPTEMFTFLSALLAQYASIGFSNSVDLQVETELPPEVWLHLDRGKFTKILNNYLSNAIKFTPIGGKIIVRNRLIGDDLRVEVEDNGRGISAEDLPNVFNRFYQSSTQGRQEEGGTGIGLSMCFELAGLMGGKAWAESTLGQGSTFYFQMPARVAEALALGTDELTEQGQSTVPQESLVAPDVRPTSVSGHSNKHLLIVEDNPDLQAYYGVILQGYKLTITGNGQEALDALNGGLSPDLIISDLMMPVMDGMELLGHLKNSDQWRHLSVIMLTAKTNQEVRIKALRYGIDDYLHKPFDDEELLVRIYNLLEHQTNRRNLHQEGEAEQGEAALQLSQVDQNWLEEVETYILDRLTDEALSVPSIAKVFAMSESTLLRQLKQLTGLTTQRYLTEVRLNKAREYLVNGTYRNVSHVAYEVGFRDAASFSRSFKRRFGKAPTEIQA